jgi:hypothetical protein
VTPNGPNHPDAQGEHGESTPTEQFEMPGEIVPHEEHDGIDVHIPGQLEPAPAARKTVAVTSNVARWVLLTLVVLLALVAGLLYTILKSPAKTAVVAATSSPSASVSASASASTAAATSSPSAGSVPSPSAGVGESGSAAATSSASAPSTESSQPSASFSPINGTAYLPVPVDGGGYVDTKVDVVISNVDYPYSTRFYCPNQTAIDWNVAGYATFTANVGIPDNAPGATGSTVTMTFADQNGKVLSVSKTSIGQPSSIRVPLAGVDRLTMTCNRQANNGSYVNYVALGNASLSGS